MESFREFTRPLYDVIQFCMSQAAKQQVTVMGAVVDAVSDVVTIDSAAIKPAPQFESSIDERFILGLVKLEERTLILMNLEALMGNAEMGILA